MLAEKAITQVIHTILAFENCIYICAFQYACDTVCNTIKNNVPLCAVSTTVTTAAAASANEMYTYVDWTCTHENVSGMNV